MSTVGRFFTSTATISRMVEGVDGSGNYKAEPSVLCSFACHIQQAAPDMAQYIGEALARTFSVWCAHGVDVREGDRLTIGADAYTVRAIQHNGTGHNRHLELTVLHAGLTA